jgi:hypothetical protein
MSSPSQQGADASAFRLPIHVRTFAQEVEKEASKASKRKGPRKAASRRSGPNGLTLIFDVETTTDAAQRFKVGFYQLRNPDLAGPDGEDGIDEERIVMDEEVLTPREARIVRAYAKRRGLGAPMSLAEFRREVLVKRGVACGALIVTFNGPFDFARVAIGAGPAHVTKWRRKIAGGFSLKYTENPFLPKIQIKSLNPRAALTELTAARRQDTSRSRRKRGQSSGADRGYFVDVKTLAAALLSRTHSLESLTKALDTPTKKVRSEDHGQELTFAYLDYARADVRATWECYRALAAKYATYGLDTPVWEILSEAGIGKATLRAMGIQPWMKAQPGEIDKGLLSLIMSTYFGGRTEVHLRRQVTRVVHTDFTAQYPTVCALQNLWRFVIGQGFTKRDATEQARKLLAEATPEMFQRPEAWPKLTMLVRVRPGRDLFPIRTGYRNERHATIGLNFLTYTKGIWVTLADCLVAKFLSGRAPAIEEAILFEPGPPQRGLRAVSILGRGEVDPYKDDLYRMLTRMREDEERRKAGKSETEQAAIEEIRGAIKITNNSVAYGIFVQVNVTPVPRGAHMRVYRPDGSSFIKRMTKVETPGPYYHPLIATFITSAARVMLALAEHRVIATGLDWAFCDTDSIAIAQPDGMTEDEFLKRAKSVVEWFRPLNPYGLDEPILKIEKVNYRPDNPKVLEPLYCWAISSKRYALFNIGDDGKPVIRKCSAHGLGHLRPCYEHDDAPPHIPPPLREVISGKERVHRWHYDAWFTIVEAALAGDPDGVKFDYHPALRAPSVSRYSATSPDLLGWFDAWNKGKAYADQVKPHGFLFILHPSAFDAPSCEIGDPVEGCEPVKDMHPVAPFDHDLKAAISKAFDRVTGAPVDPARLQTYAEVLKAYPNRPEAKFLNGGAFDTGPTARCHIVATHQVMIGKEADRLEEEFLLGLGEDLVVEYGADPEDASATFLRLREAISRFGKCRVASATGVDRKTLAKVERGEAGTTRVPHDAIAKALDTLSESARAETAENERRLEELIAAVDREGGIRPAARALGIDASNLHKLLRRDLPQARNTLIATSRVTDPNRILATMSASLQT